MQPYGTIDSLVSVIVGVAVTVMLVVPWPAPWMVIAFVRWTPIAPQVKFPAGIVIVSPSIACMS